MHIPCAYPLCIPYASLVHRLPESRPPVSAQKSIKHGQCGVVLLPLLQRSLHTGRVLCFAWQKNSGRRTVAEEQWQKNSGRRTVAEDANLATDQNELLICNTHCEKKLANDSLLTVCIMMMQHPPPRPPPWERRQPPPPPPPPRAGRWVGRRAGRPACRRSRRTLRTWRWCCAARQRPAARSRWRTSLMHPYAYPFYTTYASLCISLMHPLCISFMHIPHAYPLCISLMHRLRDQGGAPPGRDGRVRRARRAGS